MTSQSLLPNQLSGKGRHDEILILYGLGVPTAALERDYGMRPSSIRKLASRAKVRRPTPEDRALLMRAARTERIRRHAEEYPSVRLFSGVAAAA